MAGGRFRQWIRRGWLALTRIPLLADHLGLRWLLNGRVMPGGAIAILSYRGRRSGRMYRTPVEVIVEDRDRGEILVVPARGRQGDWYRNIIASGLAGVRLRGRSFDAAWRELSEEENRAALERYTSAHPRWARMIVRGLARKHHLSGDPSTAVANALPVLALSLTATEPTQP